MVKRQMGVSLLVVAVFLVGLGVVFATAERDDASENDTDRVAADRLVRDDSRIIGERGSSDVVLVEFLDFECEACKAAFPIVESLRHKYGKEVTFVARYFPLPGHANGERAARAVESAAHQGKFDEMYQKMYETQDAWGEKQTPQDDLFRDFAIDLGLDIERFESDYNSKEVADRIQRDVDDGLALGVQGTPTFFLDGRLFSPTSVADFEKAIVDALATSK